MHAPYKHTAALILLLSATASAQDTRRVGDCVVQTGALCAADNLSGANLAGVRAPYSEFARARLVDARLDRADLTGVSLAGADLRGANFTNANPTDADLRGANIDTTIFLGARTAGCLGCP